MNLEKCRFCEHCIPSARSVYIKDAEMQFARCKASYYIDECGYTQYGYCGSVMSSNCAKEMKRKEPSKVYDIVGIIFCALIILIMIVYGIVGSI